MRSSEELWKRYRKDAEITIHGHRACAKRLNDTSAFQEIDPDVPLPGGVTAHAIGKPRRYEMPLHVPSHDALVFGDAVAETEGRLVMWSSDKVDAKVDRFYRERFAPTLEPLLELDFDRVLVTHGQPVMKDGKKALADGLEGEALVPPRVGCAAMSTPTTVNGIDELKALIGQTIGPSDWREVTQEDIDKFADVSGDHQWIHVDVERAKKESPFGTTIAHGNLTLCLCDSFRDQLFKAEEGFKMGINYGWNKVRFTAPVPAGARIRASLETLSVDEKGDGWYQLEQKWTVEIEGQEKPALFAESVVRLLA